MRYQTLARLAASFGILLTLITASYSSSLFVPNSPYSFVSGSLQNNADSLTALPAVPGLYDLSFHEYLGNGVTVEVSSLPAGGGPLVLFAHVEDTAGNPTQSGAVTFQYCGDFEPSETCDAGLARWTRLNRVKIGSCVGLPGFDPGPGNACLFVTETGGFPAVNGFRFKFAGPRRGGVDSGMSDELNFTWTAAP